MRLLSQAYENGSLANSVMPCGNFRIYYFNVIKKEIETTVAVGNMTNLTGKITQRR